MCGLSLSSLGFSSPQGRVGLSEISTANLVSAWCHCLGHVDVARKYGRNVFFQLGMYEKALEMHEKDLEIKLLTVARRCTHFYTSNGRYSSDAVMMSWSIANVQRQCLFKLQNAGL